MQESYPFRDHDVITIVAQITSSGPCEGEAGQIRT